MRFSVVFIGISVTLTSAIAQAQYVAPPPDAEALAAGPKGPGDEPKIDKPKNDLTSVTLSAGGLLTTGNSRTVALTLNGAFDARRGNNGFGVSVLGNYGEAAPLPDEPMMPSAENVQGRFRYDRYISDNVSMFLIATGRYDKFQGLAFRLNLDPGFKFIVVKSPRTALWVEAGYDFQHDTRTEAGRIELDPDGNPTGVLLKKTRIDHSARLFGGFRHAFSQDVTFAWGLEYLQSFIRTDLGDRNSRLNLNMVLAAKLFKGFSVGLGFNGAYDHLPIPGRKQLDTTTTLSIIYGWSDAVPAKKDEKAKCPVCPDVKLAPVVTPVEDPKLQEGPAVTAPPAKTETPAPVETPPAEKPNP